ncbi:MAG: 2OG-Fe(II) oxygenase family protein [Mesorhizobium sp.]|nr:2OG-Fe(II) oxygenase family protein [Mesorhizobium sp.]
MIPVIDIAPLFGPASPEREFADRAIMQAAAGIGFMTVTGFPAASLLTPEARGRLLGIFGLPDAEKAKLLRWNFDPTKTNLYRGWFPLQDAVPSYKEGIDMGPDVAYGPGRVAGDDPLCEATPIPPESLLPGWRGAAADYYVAMEETGAALMRAVARGLGLPETVFDDAFVDGISTLRLTRYPLRAAAHGDADFSVEHKGERRQLIGGAHVDSGFVTLLAQDGVEGLQAQNHDGEWIDVPPADGTLAVNFGKLLDRWTGGRVRATLHRVVAPDRERFSIPFFYEPRVDAEIAPLPIEGAEPFEPFLYGDYLWDAATRFVEQQGIRHMRQPRRATA